MATRMDYTTAAQFAEIVAANPADRRVYAVRRNVTGGNPNAQSFAVSLPSIKFATGGGNKCFETALYELFNKWRFDYVKARFQDLPNGGEIDDSEFGDHEVASAYLCSQLPRVPEKLSPQRISNWFHACTQLQDALHNVLAKHDLSEQQSENQFKKFLHGLKKLVKRGAVSKKLAVQQHRLLTQVAGITEYDGIVERLILARLDEIINEKEVEDDDDMLDLTV